MKKINIIISLLIISAMLLSFSGCSIYSFKCINKWVPQENDAYYNESELYYNGKEMYVPELIGHDSTYRIMAIYDGRIYIAQDKHIKSDSSDDRYIWQIVSINTDGGDYKENFSTDFKGHIDRSRFRKKGYNSLDLNEKYIYYYNGKIVLQDFTKLVEYDLETGTADEYAVSEYKHYDGFKYQYEFASDSSYILFKNTETGEIKKLDLESMLKMNDLIKDIYNRKDKTSLTNTLALDRLFNHIEIIDDKIYIFCKLTPMDDSYLCLLFLYDIENDDLKYINNTYSISNIDQTQIVPEYK